MHIADGLPVMKLTRFSEPNVKVMKTRVQEPSRNLVYTTYCTPFSWIFFEQMTIFSLSHFFLDFRTIVGSYAIAGLHFLPMWLYGLQRLEIVNMYFGSNTVAAVTAILVSGRLTCFFVEVKLKITVSIRTKATRNPANYFCCLQH